jgi:hypothetical protein
VNTYFLRGGVHGIVVINGRVEGHIGIGTGV